MILTLAELLEGNREAGLPISAVRTRAPITMERLIELTGIYKRKYYLAPRKRKSVS